MAFNYSELPHTLQWWRSLIEWVGGVGVIVLVISILEPSTEPDQLYNAEGRSQKNRFDSKQNGQKYLVDSICSTLLVVFFCFASSV